MKPITLHPLSVFAGLALAGLAVVVTGAAQQPIIARHVPPDVQVVGQIPVEWWTYAYISAPNHSYTVPSDRYFVLTGAKIIDGLGGIPDLLVNGGPLGDDGSMRISPPDGYNNTRVVLSPGAVLTTSPGRQTGLWGYLEPVH